MSPARLATAPGADALVLLTGVDAVHVDWGRPTARPLHEVTPGELRALDLPAGSVRPEAEAAASWSRVAALAAIGTLADAAALLRGDAGTTVRTG